MTRADCGVRGGEAAGARRRFVGLSLFERFALLRFLRSL